jgi:hypothetical protein
MATQCGPTSRRAFLEQATLGFGTLALAALLDADVAGAADAATGGGDLRSRAGHLPRRATSVIMLMQVGGPSHIDLFDPKPDLKKHDGEAYAEDVEVLQPGSEAKRLFASPFQFARHGQCGMEISNLLPHIGSVADDITLVRSMYSDNNNHPQATRSLNTGKIFPGRPSLGSWISYALGS